MPDTLIYIDNTLMDEFLKENTELIEYLENRETADPTEEVKEEIKISEHKVKQDNLSDIFEPYEVSFMENRFDSLPLPQHQRPRSINYF